MGISLSTDIRERQTETLREVARATHAPTGKVLAVCETSTGEYVLAREREVAGKSADGKRDKDAAKVKVLKRTAYIADFAHALAVGLIEE